MPASRPRQQAVVADVAEVLPLPLLVDADNLCLDGCAGAEIVGKGLQRVLPHLVLGLAPEHHHAHLVHGIVGAEQKMDLGHGRAILSGGAERDESRERMPFRSHIREGDVIRVEDQNPS